MENMLDVNQEMHVKKERTIKKQLQFISAF